MPIGVDFGGTWIKVGLVDGGTVVRLERERTPHDQDPGRVLELIAQMVRRHERTPRAVGIGIPGHVDRAGKCIRLSNVPGFEGLNVADDLRARLDCQVVVDNDSGAAALGEQLFGAGHTRRNFGLFTLGTGVGGGTIIEGRRRRGENGFASQVGHNKITDGVDAAPCTCGMRGCLEAYAGAQAVLGSYRARGGHAREVRDIAAKARGGEEAAKRVFQELGAALGRGVALVQNVLDLEAVVFAGGISAAFELFEADMRTALRENVFVRPAADVLLLPSSLGEHAGVIGAAYLPQAEL